MSDNQGQREQIRALLKQDLQTEEFPRIDTSEQREATIQRLHTEADDLQTKLVIAGFSLKSVTHGEFKQHCETCMYFRRHDRHCELPELDVPVEPEWSCRLWRI